MTLQKLIGASVSQVPTNGMLGTLAFINAANAAFPAPVSFALGSAASPSLYFTGDTNTGIYSPGADQLAVSTGGTGRLFVTDAGRVGIGTASPAVPLMVTTAASGEALRLTNGTNAERLHFYTGANALVESNNSSLALTTKDAYSIIFSTTNAERMRLDSSGRLGIGTSAPGDILSATGGNIALQSTGGAGAGDRPTERRLLRSDIGSVNGLAAIGMNGAGTSGFLGEIKFYTGSADVFNAALAERARIDSSGRLLVGTSSAINTTLIGAAALEVAGNANDTAQISISRYSNDGDRPRLALIKSRSGTVGTNTIVQNSDVLGEIAFIGGDGSGSAGYPVGASILSQVDGTPGANDMPGRLVFSTTADGSATPTERMRITSAGVLQIAEAGNIQVGTTTGTKIGTATTQKIGFYNATPVVQPTAVADATDAASAITQLNALLTRMRNLGLIAT